MAPSPRSIVVALLVAIASTMLLSGPAAAATVAARTSGAPASDNGASSMHLWWPLGTTTARVSVDLEVLDPGDTTDLRFWAVQVGFVDASGTVIGGAHLGLQRHRHAPKGAVNWGGYVVGGARHLESKSKLRDVLNSPNTYHYDWQPNEVYRLVIEGDGGGWWTASIVRVSTGVRTEIGRLHGGGSKLSRPVVWTEAFARCEASAAVRWSSFEPAPAYLVATYQSHDDGGCTNTDASIDRGVGGAVQRAAAQRTTPHGALVGPLS